MRCEDDFARHPGNCCLESQTLILHAHANRFEDGKCAVAFVEVKDTGRNSQGFEDAESSDSEQQLLADSNAEIAAIEARGKFAIFRSVALYIGIEQVEVTATDLDAPDFSLE